MKGAQVRLVAVSCAGVHRETAGRALTWTAQAKSDHRLSTEISNRPPEISGISRFWPKNRGTYTKLTQLLFVDLLFHFAYLKFWPKVCGTQIAMPQPSFVFQRKNPCLRPNLTPLAPTSTPLHTPPSSPPPSPPPPHSMLSLWQYCWIVDNHYMAERREGQEECFRNSALTAKCPRTFG